MFSFVIAEIEKYEIFKCPLVLKIYSMIVWKLRNLFKRQAITDNGNLLSLLCLFKDGKESRNQFVKSINRNGRQGHSAYPSWMFQQGDCILYVKQHLAREVAEMKGVLVVENLNLNLNLNFN
jgi:hypothetical protein